MYVYMHVCMYNIPIHTQNKKQLNAQAAAPKQGVEKNSGGKSARGEDLTQVVRDLELELARKNAEIQQVCVCVYMYVYVCVYTYGWFVTWISIYCLYVCVCVYMYVYVCVCIPTVGL
jgi:hypothetical protein